MTDDRQVLRIGFSSEVQYDQEFYCPSPTPCYLMFTYLQANRPFVVTKESCDISKALKKDTGQKN
jgi:hypothetical protein